MFKSFYRIIISSPLSFVCGLQTGNVSRSLDRFSVSAGSHDWEVDLLMLL